MKKIPRILNLPKITDQRGNLTFIEGNRHIPFVVKRVYYLYDVPAGAMRGGHAHKKLEQFVIAASGSFTVVIDDGRKRRKFFLEPPALRAVHPAHGLARTRGFFLGIDLRGFSLGGI